ncbi:MAG: hypothetical protein WCR08_11560 [Gammaproteobacteria bacterium]
MRRRTVAVNENKQEHWQQWVRIRLNQNFTRANAIYQSPDELRDCDARQHHPSPSEKATTGQSIRSSTNHSMALAKMQPRIPEQKFHTHKITKRKESYAIKVAFLITSKFINTLTFNYPKLRSRLQNQELRFIQTQRDDRNPE